MKNRDTTIIVRNYLRSTGMKSRLLVGCITCLLPVGRVNGHEPDSPTAPLPTEAETPSTEAPKLFVEGRYAEALAAAEREHAAIVARSGPDHADSLQAANNLAVIQARAGKLADAKALATATLDARRKLLGPDHPDVFTTLNNLGTIQHTLGDYAEAEKTLQEAYDGRKRLLGDKHPSTAQSMANLGRVMMARGKRAEGVKLLEEALAIQLADPSTPKTSLASTKCSVARAKVESSGALATQDAQDARESAAAAFGESHPRYALALSLLAESRSLPDARDDFSRARAIHKTAGAGLTPDYATTLMLHADHAVGLELGLVENPGEEDVRSVRQVGEEAYDVCGRVFGDNHPTTATAGNDFALTLNIEPDRDRVRAKRLVEEAMAIRRSRLGDNHPATAESDINLAAIRFDDTGSVPLEDLAPAMIAFERAFEADDPNAVSLGINLASIYFVAKVPSERILSIIDRIVPVSQKRFGAEDQRSRLLERMRAALEPPPPSKPAKRT